MSGQAGEGKGHDAATGAHAHHGHGDTSDIPRGSVHPVDAHTGHDKHAGHSVAMFRDKFWISLALTVPTLVWGHMLPRVFSYTPPTVPGRAWIAPAFGT